MLGTIVNVITVLIGGTIGTFFGNRIRPEYSETFIKVMGFITACIGIQSAANTMNFLVVVLSLVIGTLIGILLEAQAAGRVENIPWLARGDRAEKPLSMPKSEDEIFAEMYEQTKANAD